MPESLLAPTPQTRARADTAHSDEKPPNTQANGSAPAPGRVVDLVWILSAPGQRPLGRRRCAVARRDVRASGTGRGRGVRFGRRSGSTCDGEPFPGTSWPGDSPYVTSVGGTRLVLNHRNQRVNEVVWNDLRWLSPGMGGGAGGGGIADGYARPPYQRYIHVPGNRRATPDMAVHASMLPGYPIYANGQWVQDGGTSAAAPLAAAAFSAISARLQAAGKPPLGPVNGLLYWLERYRPGALYDIVSGTNGYDVTSPGTARAVAMTSPAGSACPGSTRSLGCCRHRPADQTDRPDRPTWIKTSDLAHRDPGHHGDRPQGPDDRAGNDHHAERRRPTKAVVESVARVGQRLS